MKLLSAAACLVAPLSSVLLSSVLLLIVLLFPLRLSAQPSRIEDNSFLIEEAYNQERGVVQHINTFNKSSETDAWQYAFTQEWPMFGNPNHQFSYTIPYTRLGEDEGGSNGLDDVLVHYRYQLHAGDCAVAPRFSVSLPTGDNRENTGIGSIGYQFNLPVSIRLGESFVNHWNAGLTFNPSEKDEFNKSESTLSYNYGTSLVYLAHPNFNLLVEAVGESVEIAGEQDGRTDSFTINPGFRSAINFESGLQIVPGVSVPFGVGRSSDERSIFFYLSFEHPFTDRT